MQERPLRSGAPVRAPEGNPAKKEGGSPGTGSRKGGLWLVFCSSAPNRWCKCAYRGDEYSFIIGLPRIHLSKNFALIFTSPALSLNP